VSVYVQQACLCARSIRLANTAGLQQRTAVTLSAGRCHLHEKNPIQRPTPPMSWCTVPSLHKPLLCFLSLSLSLSVSLSLSLSRSPSCVPRISTQHGIYYLAAVVAACLVDRLLLLRGAAVLPSHACKQQAARRDQEKESKKSGKAKKKAKAPACPLCCSCNARGRGGEAYRTAPASPRPVQLAKEDSAGQACALAARPGATQSYDSVAKPLQSLRKACNLLFPCVFAARPEPCAGTSLAGSWPGAVAVTGCSEPPTEVSVSWRERLRVCTSAALLSLSWTPACERVLGHPTGNFGESMSDSWAERQSTAASDASAEVQLRHDAVVVLRHDDGVLLQTSTP
jgi:hypothetical protein